MATLLAFICGSLLFSRSVMFSFLRPHGLQHTRLLCRPDSRGLLKLMSIESVMPVNILEMRVDSLSLSKHGFFLLRWELLQGGWILQC